MGEQYTGESPEQKMTFAEIEMLRDHTQEHFDRILNLAQTEDFSSENQNPILFALQENLKNLSNRLTNIEDSLFETKIPSDQNQPEHTMNLSEIEGLNNHIEEQLDRVLNLAQSDDSSDQIRDTILLGVQGALRNFSDRLTNIEESMIQSEE